MLDKDFWNKYEIPYKFKVGIKPVRSGYSERSWGNGSNMATVYHIVLDEDVEMGRLRRKKGEYLCSQPSFIPYSDIKHYEANNAPAVTCKKCLHYLEKFKKD